nr:MAG TPA: hypothetical protein [Caudoviricetes sp.]
MFHSVVTRFISSIPIARSNKKSLDSLKSRLFLFAITHYLTHF